MPKPGTKPTPASIRLVSGRRHTTRHGTEDELKAQCDLALDQFGRMKKPRYLKGEAAKAWKMFVVPAVWLDAARFWRLCTHVPTLARIPDEPLQFPGIEGSPAARILCRPGTD